VIRVPRVPRPRRPILFSIVLTALLAFPLGVVLANHQFTDVPTTSPFHADIDALVNSGVTAGCGGGKYCPGKTVTREQMAAFLNRLGALGPGKAPVVNANKLDGIDSTGFLKAGNTTTLLGGSAWDPHGTLTPTTFQRFISGVNVSGDGQVVLALITPQSLGGATYGLAAVQVCYSAGGGATITDMNIFRSDTTGTPGGLAYNDPTNRTTSGCYSVAPNIAAGNGLGLTLVLTGGGTVRLEGLRATWSTAAAFSEPVQGDASQNGN